MGEKEVTFEDSISRLEAVVRRLEGGQNSLDEALQLFSEGINLSRYCSCCLEQAEQQISLLMTDEAGRPGLTAAPDDLLKGGKH